MTIQIINRECQSVMGVVRQMICIDRLPAEPGIHIYRSGLWYHTPYRQCVRKFVIIDKPIGCK
mgnify:FL=1